MAIFRHGKLIIYLSVVISITSLLAGQGAAAGALVANEAGVAADAAVTADAVVAANATVAANAAINSDVAIVAGIAKNSTAGIFDSGALEQAPALPPAELPPPEFNPPSALGAPPASRSAAENVTIDRSEDRNIDEIVEMAKALPHTGFDARRGTRYAEPPLFTAPYGAGSLDAEDLADALNALAMVRYLAGLPYDNIALSDLYGNSAQHKAVLMAVSGYSHHPAKPGDMSDEFFQTASLPSPGYESIFGGISNLSNAILGFVADPGANNIDQAGHRVMFLMPNNSAFGFGYAQNPGSPVSGGHLIAVHSSYDTTPADTYVAWPNSGAFPIQYFTWSSDVPARAPIYPWSLSLGAEYRLPDKNGLTLTLTRTRDDISDTTWIFNSSTPNLGDGGYENPALDHLSVNGRDIVFRPNANTLGPILDGDAFTVRLTGVISAAGEETALEYSVRFFDLAKEMGRSSVRFYVYDESDSAPIQGAQVTIDGQTLSTGDDGSVIFRVDNDSIYNYTISKEGYAAKTGSVEIADSGASVDAALAEPDFILGDTNGDGVVNMQDVLLIYQYFRGKISLSSDELRAADVNGDGKADLQDVLLVYQYFRGKITEYK